MLIALNIFKRRKQPIRSLPSSSLYSEVSYALTTLILISGSIALDIGVPNDDMFKLNLADALTLYLSQFSPVAVQNLQLHQQGNCVV